MNFLEKLNNVHKENLKLYAAEHDDPFVIRKSQAILLLEYQASEETIELLTGYKRGTAVKFRKLFVQMGLDALVCKRKKKTPRALLTLNQKNEIIKVIHTQTPEDFGYKDVKFWTTNILGHLIFEQYNVKYKSKTSIYLIFRQAKFTYHKPEKNYEKHDVKVVAEWKEKMQPIIQEYWNDENVVILTGDEMILSSETTTQKVWLPVNEQPKISVNKKRELCHIYGFLNIKTGFDHAFKTPNQTGDTTVTILKKLSALYKNRSIVLIWDNASWHRSAAVREYLSTTTQFKLYNFPPYSPELNPQEHVWKAGRSAVTHNVFINKINETSAKLIRYFNEKKFEYDFLGFTA